MAILCIIDGMTDGPEFSFQPFEHLSAMAAQGAWGQLATTPKDCSPESLTCILTLLGLEVPPQPGRAYFEALGVGIPIDGDDLVLRCSLCRFDEQGRLISACGQGMPPLEAERLAKEFGLIPIEGYKNLLLVPHGAVHLAQTHTLPPYEHLGTHIQDLLPQGPGLRQLVLDSYAHLRPYAFLPWGQAVTTPLPAPALRTAAVCATQIVRGLALAAGYFTPEIAGATADTNTNLEAKVAKALELAKEYELVLLHFNGADEAAHRKNPLEKLEFLHKIDREVLAVLRQSGQRVLVTSDHSTSAQTGAHAGSPQPFVLHGGNARGNLGLHSGTKAVSLLMSY